MSRKPALARMSRTRAGSAKAKGPGAPGVGGATGGSSAAAAANGSAMKGFSAGVRQHTKASRAPGFKARRMLANAAWRVGEEHHAEAREQRIETGRCEGVDLRIGLDERDVRGAGRLGTAAGGLQQGPRYVEPGDRAALPYSLSQRHAGLAGAAADIEDALALCRRKRLHRLIAMRLQLGSRYSCKLTQCSPASAFQ